MEIIPQTHEYFLFQGTAFTDDEIKKIQSKCNIELPSDYIDFARQYGGVSIRTSKYKIK